MTDPILSKAQSVMSDLDTPFLSFEDGVEIIAKALREARRDAPRSADMHMAVLARSASRLDDDEKGVATIDTLGGKQEAS